MAMEEAGRGSNAVIAVLTKKAADALADDKSKAGSAAGAAVAGMAGTGVSVTDTIGAAGDAGLAGGILSLVVALVQWIRRGRQKDRAEAFTAVRNVVIEGGVDLLLRKVL